MLSFINKFSNANKIYISLFRLIFVNFTSRCYLGNMNKSDTDVGYVKPWMFIGQ